MEHTLHTYMQDLSLVLGLAEDDVQVASALERGSELLGEENLGTEGRTIVAVGMVKGRFGHHEADSGL